MKFLKNNAVLNIAEGRPGDAAEILEYLKKVGGESDFLLMDSNGVSFGIEQEQEYLKKNLESKNNKTFVGKIEHKIVSVGGITSINRDKIKHNVTLGVSVAKDYWNLGIGTHMMNHILNYCRMEHTIHNVHLEVREDNKFAIKLYESLGFKKVGKYTRKMRIGDTYYDELIYELLLR